MPNWIEGTMKLRGKREDIKRFLDNELDPSTWVGEQQSIEEQVENNSCDDYLEYSFHHEPHIKGTRRAFITDDYLYMEGEEGSVCLDIKQAWSFGDDKELELWKNNAHKYNIDIKLFGIERGMEFCQEVIALRSAERVVNNVIQYEDWDWDCPFPNMGG